MGLPWRHWELRCSPGVRPVCWGAHLLGALTNHLVYKGKLIGHAITDGNRSAQVKTIKLYINKLTASDTLCIAIKRHKVNIAC